MQTGRSALHEEKRPSVTVEVKVHRENLKPGAEPETAKNYQICSRCIMDTSDPEISFDEQGICNHCQASQNLFQLRPQTKKEREQQLNRIVSEIKTYGEKREYDCLVGLSGGVDSSYVAYMAKKLGLRPLAMHFDGGWNSELAVKNIEDLVKKLNIDLYTFVCDWEEMKDLQLAFFRSGVPNADIPQDHGIVAALYRVAKEKKIRYILNGGNLSTESILPNAWGYDSRDGRHLKAIQKSFGTLKLRRYPVRGVIKSYIYDAYLSPTRMIRVLDLVPYVKSEAMKILQNDLGWRYYGGKHYESVFTRFFQGYYLPKRFGFDKRRAHLSSLIASGQMTRGQALEEMKTDSYSKELKDSDFIFVAKKLRISEKELIEIIDSPPRSSADYPSSQRALNALRMIKDGLQKLRASVKTGKRRPA